jgi:hypothetical protein
MESVALMLVQQYGLLIVDCLVIAVETIGLVKFFDNFFFPNRDLSLREKCFLELLICCICAFVNSGAVPELTNKIINLFMLSLSFTQLAYDYIILGVRNLIDRAFKVKENSNREGK